MSDNQKRKRPNFIPRDVHALKTESRPVIFLTPIKALTPHLSLSLSHTHTPIKLVCLCVIFCICLCLAVLQAMAPMELHVAATLMLLVIIFSKGITVFSMVEEEHMYDEIAPSHKLEMVTGAAFAPSVSPRFHFISCYM